ncbi:MAG: lycopene cyclase family protein [Bacteroidota bacterium]
MDNHFDFAIIGAGAAGLHLSLAMIRDDYFKNKKILILEKGEKNQNDRTWSFWENGSGNWDHILHHSWGKGAFYSDGFEKKLQMKGYRYKMIRSVNFYKNAKDQIFASDAFVWKKTEVDRVSQSDTGVPVIHTSIGKFSADHIFDSRIDPEFLENKDNHIHLLQHFKGWFIKTPKPIFDPDKFVMMDFRLRWKNGTSFTYVLPFSPNEAMIEFTLFDQKMLKDQDYDHMLKQYIYKYLKIEDYEILEEEKGVIPMTSFPFYKKNNHQITKIGTAGGWVKPSSGYAFKHCEKFSERIVRNIKNNKVPSHQLFYKRYRWYDSLLLDILWSKNELGAPIFASMFKRNKVVEIFKFLDEEGSLASDLRVITSFHPTPFLKALGKQIMSFNL